MNWQDVQRKARFGHRAWLWWKDRNGNAIGARLSVESMRVCLLDCGTKGSWTLFCEDGTPMKGFWALGIIQLSNLRHGAYSR